MCVFFAAVDARREGGSVARPEDDVAVPRGRQAGGHPRDDRPGPHGHAHRLPLPRRGAVLRVRAHQSAERSVYGRRGDGRPGSHVSRPF